MPIPRRVKSLIQNLLFRTRVEQDLDEEMRACLDILAHQKIKQGLSPGEAKRLARIELGGVEQVKEHIRDVRIGAAIERVLQDVRYGLRQLARSPVFTAVAGITLALGIGSTAAIFSVVDAVILRPLALPHSDRLVQVREEYPSGFKASSVANYLDFTNAGDLFERATPLSTWQFWFGDFSGGERLQEVTALEASSDFLPLVGVEPMLGRGFLPDERFNWATRPSSTILTYDLWQQHFEGSADAIGKTFTLTHRGFYDKVELTVVGVLPQRFRMPPLEMRGGIRPYGDRDLLLPPRMAGDFAFGVTWFYPMSARSTRAYDVLGRLKPDVSVEQARARLGAIAAGIAETYPETNAGLQAVVTPLPQLLRQYYGLTLYLLWAAAGLVLLIACVNVASLLLGRGVTRRWEFAVRSALGAGRGRLFRQLIAESLLLGLLGGVAGLILAFWGTRALVAMVPAEVYRLDQVGVDPRVLAFVTGTSLLTAVLFGLLPAFKGAGSDRVECLTEGTRGSMGSLRALNSLVVAELALALVLIAGAGLLLRTHQRLTGVPLGFDRENLMAVQVEKAPGPLTKYGGRRGGAALYSRIRDRLTEVPGVVSVGGGHPPLSPSAEWLQKISLGDRPLPPPEQRLLIEFPSVSSGYFETLGVRVLGGRTFTDADDAHRLDWTDPPGGCESNWCAVEHAALRTSWTVPVVINDVMARRFWPGESALGKVVYRGYYEDPERAQEESYTWDRQENDQPPVRRVVVGIVSEIKRVGLAQGLRPQMYEVRNDIRAPFLVRTRTDARGMVDEVRGAIEAVDSELTVTQVEMMQDRFRRAAAEERFRMFLTGLFAAMAVVLAAVGLFGLMAYAVRQRTREIGIRVSLGAQRTDILQLVGRRGLVLIVVGGAIGLGGAFGVTRFMSSLLYGVTPWDPVSFFGAALLLGTVGLLACYLPALRATRVDPLDVLRTE